MTEHEQKAVDLFTEGCNCSQAVFAAFCDITGFDKDTALRLASGFGGGFGRQREVCGAVCGMTMAAGFIAGYSDTQNPQLKTDCYAAVHTLMQAFKAEKGSYICREILGITAEQYSPVATPRTAEFYKKRPCPGCIATAARLIDEMLLSDGSGQIPAKDRG